MSISFPKKLRARKLIKPGLQLRLVGAFAGFAALAMLVQFLLLGYLMIRRAMDLEGPGGQLADQVPGALLVVLGVSMGVILPIFVGFGILLTFRYAGPVYRFERFLEAVARGEQVDPCTLRSKDELQSLCDAINTATSAERERNSKKRSSDSLAA